MLRIIKVYAGHSNIKLVSKITGNVMVDKLLADQENYVSVSRAILEILSSISVFAHGAYFHRTVVLAYLIVLI